MDGGGIRSGGIGKVTLENAKFFLTDGVENYRQEVIRNLQ
jgi:hypothetical protein